MIVTGNETVIPSRNPSDSTSARIPVMFKNASLKVRNSGAAPNHAATRIVRKLADSPASLYAWLSGPPTTGLERKRAQLADIVNSRGSGSPFG